jgi:hypothetical protein
MRFLWTSASPLSLARHGMRTGSDRGLRAVRLVVRGKLTKLAVAAPSAGLSMRPGSTARITTVLNSCTMNRFAFS